MTQQTKIFIFRTAADGWRLGLPAIWALPGLFVSATTISLGLRLIDQSLLASPALAWLAAMLGSAIMWVIDNTLIASVAIGVHRLVLLGEAADRPVWSVPPVFPRFVGWLVLTSFLLLIPAGMLLVWDAQSHPVAAGVLVPLAWVIIAVAWTRTVILFPAMVVGAPGATWANAWHDSRGSSWRIFCTGLVSLLPFGILIAVALFGSTLAFGPQQPSPMPQATSVSWLMIVIEPIATVVLTAVTTAIASRCYQHCADRIERA